MRAARHGGEIRETATPIESDAQLVHTVEGRSMVSGMKATAHRVWGALGLMAVAQE